MEENKRKTIILTFIGALTLLFVVVGGTFAYFQIVNDSEGSTNTNFETATDALNKYGTPILEKGSDLYINLSASDMAYSKKGQSFWAVNDVDEELGHKDDKSNYVISTAKIQDPNSEGSVSDAYLKCTSELTITVGGTKASSLKAGDGKLYLGVTSETEGNKGSIDPDSYDLFDLVQEQGEEGKKVTVNYTIVGFTSANVTADVEIVNRDDDQNYLAGDNTNEESEITITITNTNLSCSVSEKPVYAKLEHCTSAGKPNYYGCGETYRSVDYFQNIETITFVDYVPSEEELSSLTHWDLSDTASGTPKNSVIGWIVKNNNTVQKSDNDLQDPAYPTEMIDLYDMYIGSNSKIYFKDMSYNFYTMPNLKAITFDNIDTSEVNNMSGLFWNEEISKINEIKGLEKFDTSSVANMSHMFSGCESLTTLDLSTFNTSQVTDMSSMFSSISVDLPFKEWPNFVTTNVEDMSSMFSYYKGKTLDLSSFDTSKVTDMSRMFYNTSVELPFKNWPNFVTTSVENMSDMFSSYKGTTLDLSSFDTSKVTDMSYMFYNCINLATLDLSSFTFDNVTGNGKYGDGNYDTFNNVPESCQVKIKKSQQEIFEDKFPHAEYGREFLPTYVD